MLNFDCALHDFYQCDKYIFKSAILRLKFAHSRACLFVHFSGIDDLVGVYVVKVGAVCCTIIFTSGNKVSLYQCCLLAGGIFGCTKSTKGPGEPVILSIDSVIV